MKIKLSRTGRRLSVLIGILTTMIASGCASPDTARLVARTKTTAFYTVTITFDSNGCPTSVTPPSQPSCTLPDDGLCVNPGKAVQWVSKPAGTAFEVYFDPFVGRPYVSHGTDEKTSPVVVRVGSLAGDYKYSVLGVVCTGADPVLDPPLRVEY
jgi:hypothetical protein